MYPGKYAFKYIVLETSCVAPLPTEGFCAPRIPKQVDPIFLLRLLTALVYSPGDNQASHQGCKALVSS